MPSQDETPPPWWRTRFGHVAIGVAVVLLFFLLNEHTAHVFGLLPYLLLLACPLMHFFLHHDGHHRGKRGGDASQH